jgi:hypothetical protein
MSIAWIAGFYEGEGCLEQTSLHGFRISIASTDLDVLIKAQSFMESGTINPLKKYKEHHKDAWRYRLGDKKTVSKLLQNMLPWLGNRRAYDALNALDKMDGI